MNTLPRLRMTAVEEAGAAGAHPENGITEKSLAPRIKYLITPRQTRRLLPLGAKRQNKNK